VDAIWNPIEWLTVKKVLEESATLASTFSRVDDVDRLIDSFGIDLKPLLLHNFVTDSILDEVVAVEVGLLHVDFDTPILTRNSRESIVGSADLPFIDM
jgi:hypothetical protein